MFDIKVILIKLILLLILSMIQSYSGTDWNSSIFTHSFRINVVKCFFLILLLSPLLLLRILKLTIFATGVTQEYVPMSTFRLIQNLDKLFSQCFRPFFFQITHLTSRRRCTYHNCRFLHRMNKKKFEKWQNKFDNGTFYVFIYFN